MSKNITEKINSPNLMITLSLSNDEFSYLTDLVNLNFTKINNGIFIKNNSNSNGDIISIKFSDILNSFNTIEIINNDNIFIEIDDITKLQLKRQSSNPVSVSILAN